MSNQSETKAQKTYQRPHYAVTQAESAYEVSIYLPGVAPGDASITLDKNSLTVEAERSPYWQGRGEFLHREIPDAAYRLQLELNVQVDEDKITASSSNGILKIHLPVAEAAQPKKIPIQ